MKFSQLTSACLLTTSLCVISAPLFAAGEHAMPHQQPHQQQHQQQQSHQQNHQWNQNNQYHNNQWNHHDDDAYFYGGFYGPDPAYQDYPECLYYNDCEAVITY